MNSNNPEQHYDEHYHTRRSEKYRHPQGQYSDQYANENRFNRGYYGGEGNYRSAENNFYDRGNDNAYSSSRNYGNMGSYGGAQGYGSTRGGYSSQRQEDDRMNHNFDSGQGSPYNDYDDYRGSRGGSRTGNYTNYDSFNSNQQDNRDRDWNSDHDRIDWNSSRGNNSRNTGWETNNRNSDWQYDRNRGNRGYSQDSDRYGNDASDWPQEGTMRRYGSAGNRFEDNDFREDEYSPDRWNRQVPRGDFSSNDGNYGSLDPYRAEGRLGQKPYGLSGYYGGGYGLDY